MRFVLYASVSNAPTPGPAISSNVFSTPILSPLIGDYQSVCYLDTSSGLYSMATISFYQSFVVDRRGIFNSSSCSIQSRLFTVTYTASYSLSGVVSTTPRVMYNVTYGRVSTFVSVHAASSLLDRVSVECRPLNNGSAWEVGASVYASFMDCAPLQLASQSSVSTLYAIAGVETSISGSRVLYSTDSRLSRVDLPPVSSAVVCFFRFPLHPSDRRFSLLLFSFLLCM